MGVGEFVGRGVGKWRELNRNVQLVLGFTALNSVSLALYNGVMSNYTYMISGESNSFVGALSSIEGIGQLGCAIPSGYLADKYRRDTIIKVAGGVGLFGIIVGLIVMYYVPPFQGKCDDGESIGSGDCVFPLFQCLESICIFLVILFFSQGAWLGLSDPPIESIFADSVMTGERTGIYTVRFNTRVLFSCLGALMGIGLLLILGDKWELSILQKVFVFGMLLKIIPSILCFFFDDDNSLGRESEGGAWNEERERGEERDEDEENLVEWERERQEEETEEEEGVEREGKEGGEREEEEDGDDEEGFSLKCFHPKSKHFIPFLITLSDLIIACGAGMTIQFFPLYFRNLNLSPVSVTIIFLIQPIVVAIISSLSHPFSKLMGRIPTILILSGLGIILLIVMVFIQNPIYTAILFILKSGFRRAANPLKRSVLMDAVEKSARTKWNSLESLRRFSWTGSSLVGGVLIDKHGYGFTFLITAALFFVAWCVLLPLVNLDGPPCSQRKGDFEIVKEEEGEEGGDGVEMKEFQMEEEDEEGEGEGGDEGERRGEE